MLDTDYELYTLYLGKSLTMDNGNFYLQITIQVLAGVYMYNNVLK